MKRIIATTVLLACAGSAEVTVKQVGQTHIQVDIDGKPFTAFFFGPETNKPYLHPLRTAEGLVVTRSWPMETVEGEAKDHPHHQGVWFTHGDVNGFDFWANSKLTPKHGRVVLDPTVPMRHQGGAKTGIIHASFNWVAPDDKTLVKEQRRMTFYDDDNGLRTIDFDITLKAAAEPVKFGDTKEGTFAIRVHDGMTEKAKNGVMTSSTGATSMKDVWGKSFPWVDYAGTINGTPVGITIMDHPQNPGHPTHWHSRDYGLFAANIFGHHDFYRDKSKDGSAMLEGGKPWRFRYRVVIHPGLTDKAKIEELYQRYVRANAK